MAAARMLVASASSDMLGTGGACASSRVPGDGGGEASTCAMVPDDKETNTHDVFRRTDATWLVGAGWQRTARFVHQSTSSAPGRAKASCGCSARASIVRWWLERARIRMVADPLELMGLVVRNFGAVKNFDWEATNKTVMQSFFAP